MNLRTFATGALLTLVAPGVAMGHGEGGSARPLADRLAQQPAPGARVEVLVLEGTMGDGGVAASLDMPHLRQPPFSTYTQITVLSRSTLALTATAAATNVPDGSVRVSLGGRTREGRYTVDVAFVQGAHTSSIQFVAAAGEPFFTVRSRRPDHAIIFGFIVRQ